MKISRPLMCQVCLFKKFLEISYLRSKLILKLHSKCDAKSSYSHQEMFNKKTFPSKDHFICNFPCVLSYWTMWHISCVLSYWTMNLLCEDCGWHLSWLNQCLMCCKCLTFYCSQNSMNGGKLSMLIASQWHW